MNFFRANGHMQTDRGFETGIQCRDNGRRRPALNAGQKKKEKAHIECGRINIRGKRAKQKNALTEIARTGHCEEETPASKQAEEGVAIARTPP